MTTRKTNKQSLREWIIAIALAAVIFLTAIQAYLLFTGAVH